MDEQIYEELETTNDPVVETEVIEKNDDEGSSIGGKAILGLGAVAIGAAGGWAVKKFGPKVKAFTDKKKLERLKKQQEKLAAKQAANQVKINQMESPKSETGKEE